jgi:SAM-dependent methyltransferase
VATEERWRKAQEYERGYWERVASAITDDPREQLGFYEWRAGQLTLRLERLGHAGLLDGTSRILELGSGPVGVVGSLPGSRRVAVDPLNRVYGENPRLAELRDPSVEYQDVPGEALPFEAGSFDLVIMENCIDHVRDVDAVMVGIRRVLVPGGVLYLTVNARSAMGYVVHRLLARAALDPGHPHTFTARRFRKMIARHGFVMEEFEEASRSRAWLEHLRSPLWRHRLKAVLGVAEHLLSAVATKPA